MSTQSLLLNFTQSESIQFVSSLIILVALLTGLIVRRKHTNYPILKYAIYWLLIAISLIFLYSFKGEFTSVKNRFISALIPSRAIDNNGLLTIKQSSNNHFMIDVLVNDKPIVFMVDTGATSVVLSLDDAKNAGIDISKLNFYREVFTANGTVKVADAKVDIKIGGFELQNFSVLVNPSDATDSLLGMSLLNKFESISFKDDTMMLVY
jgi:aspartyl protease family protein